MVYGLYAVRRLFQSRGLSNFVIVAIIIITSFFVYTYNRPSEFIGDDDYAVCRQYVNFGMWDIFPDQATPEGYYTWIMRNSAIFFGHVHGQGVGLIYGPLFRVLDLFGVPISKELLQLPIALMGVISCFVFYFVLLKANFSRSFSFLGCSLLLTSPLFTHSSRGFSLGWLVSTIFIQVISILALQHLSERKYSQVVLGACFLFMTMSDILFFLTIPALVIAYTLRRLPLFTKAIPLSAIKDLIHEGYNSLKPKTIWLPSIIMVAITLLMSLFIILGNLGFMTQFTRLLTHNNYFNSVNAFSFISYYYRNQSWLFGEVFPFVFLIAAVLPVTILRRQEKDGLLWNYAVIGSIGFGILWYLIVPNNDISITICYQVHLLLPFLLLVLITAKSLVDYRPRLKIITTAGLIFLLVSSIVSQLGLIWGLKPLIINSSIDILPERSWGSIDKNSGTKAVGYLVRKILESRHDNGDSKDFSVISNHYSNSFTTFAGLQSQGLRYRKEHGIKVHIPPGKYNDISPYLPAEIINSRPLCVILDFRCSASQEGESPNTLGNQTSYSSYDIFDKDKLIAGLFVFPAVEKFPGAPDPGIYQLDSLDRCFDQTYHKLKDFVCFF